MEHWNNVGYFEETFICRTILKLQRTERKRYTLIHNDFQYKTTIQLQA